MKQIVPTITAENPHLYRQEIERVAGFAARLHIDLADGVLAPNRLINPIQAWWPEGHAADIHLMFARPEEHLETLISLLPNLVMIHAESEGDKLEMIRKLKEAGIKAGLAFLQQTETEEFAGEIAVADHVLIFGGKLGYHGGEADLGMLSKVDKIKEINPGVEISFDGGINDSNIKQISDSGVDIFNVGGFIQKADAPQDAYDILVKKLKQ